MERNIQNLVFKRKDFKEDLKILKQRITKVRQSGIAIRKLYRTKRNEIIQKHVYSINHLQADLTEGIKVLTKSQEIRSGKTSLNSFRRKAAEMYNKYHISTRDLYDRKKIKSDWELRYLLQQHRRLYSYARKYRFGIRIFPGGERNSARRCLKLSYKILDMERFLQSIRGQLPVVYDIVDRIQSYLNTQRPVMATSAQNNAAEPFNKRSYNLRPRKPVVYKA